MKSKKPLLVVFDGHCPICRATMKKLERMYGERILGMDFRIAAPQDIHPSLTEEGCQARMHVVEGDRVHGGAEAVVRLARMHPVYRIPVLLYYVPPIGWMAERLYAWVSRNRFRISKLLGLKQEVECTDACMIHTPPKKK